MVGSLADPRFMYFSSTSIFSTKTKHKLLLCDYFLMIVVIVYSAVFTL